VSLEDVSDADALVFPEIGAALMSGTAAQARGVSAFGEVDADSPIESIDPELFVFADSLLDDYSAQAAYRGTADGVQSEYLRGFLMAANTIANDLGRESGAVLTPEEEVEVAGATWGLAACRVPQSLRSGAGIKVAVLDTGFATGHPDFAGRPIVSHSFVGQPVQDLHGHGTHCTGTACGTKVPPGTTPRYGIAHQAAIHIGKVLSNTGGGTQAQVLAGMNWAISQRCQVISMSLGSQSGVQPSYTAAGRSALNAGCLIVAAAGNAGSQTGSPANSPTIFSVAALDSNLRPSSFSNFGKVEIAAPGRDVFSSWPMPTRYKTISGTSMATPHVAGCAALWAQTSPNLRGVNLWRKLQATARKLPFPAARVGAGLVQAP
jgi:subtilisin family serine protease